jgi:hypothetical protein
LILNQRLSPDMLDAILTTRAGFVPQKTEEPRFEDDPDNLYTPIRGHGQKRLQGALAEPPQLAADAPGGEAGGCGWHDAETVSRPAKEGVKSASGSPESELNTRVTLTPL